jgi:hypothetical protein
VLHDDEALAERLGAEITVPGVLRLERRWPLGLRYGRFRPGDGRAALPLLAAGNGAGSEAEASAGRSASELAPSEWGFIDTETSGLAGGTGTWVFNCGIGRLDDGALRLRQWLLTRLDAEPEFLRQLADELADVALLVSYNGKSFDLPLLQARYRLAGLDAPSLGRRGHLDLLHPVRRAFATRWPDCRLATAERRLLGIEREDDLPGAEAPAAWLDWLHRADGRRLGAVLRHNRLDLVALAALVPALARVEGDPVSHGADVGALARLRLRLGDRAGAERLLASAGSSLGEAERLLLASLHRRRGDWQRALTIWEGLAAAGSVPALEALAKYHEHRAGEPGEALRLTQRLPAGPERERRSRRLQRRLGSRAP